MQQSREIMLTISVDDRPKLTIVMNANIQKKRLTETCQYLLTALAILSE